MFAVSDTGLSKLLRAVGGTVLLGLSPLFVGGGGGGKRCQRPKGQSISAPHPVLTFVGEILSSQRPPLRLGSWRFVLRLQVARRPAPW